MLKSSSILFGKSLVISFISVFWFGDITKAIDPDIVQVLARLSNSDRVSFTSGKAIGEALIGGDGKVSFSWTDPNSPSDDTFYYMLDSFSNVSQIDPNLSIKWLHQDGTDALDIGQSITTDSTGNIYIVGSTYGSTFGRQVNAGDSDAFIMKYSADG